MAIPQLPDDFLEFLRLLQIHEVEYLIVGGYAVAFHGYPRATQDLDIWIARDDANARRVVAVLRDFGFDDPAVETDLFTTQDRLVRMGVPPMRLEILTSVTGLSFASATPRAHMHHIDGIEVRLVSLTDLRTNKLAAGRPKDLADLEELPDPET